MMVRELLRARGMAQWVKDLQDKPDDLSLIAVAHMVEGF